MCTNIVVHLLWCKPCKVSALTRNTYVTAASIELLTGAGAHLLFRACVNMNVIWSVLQVLRQDSKARTAIFSCPEDGSLCPISPEDVLLEHSHGIWVQDPMHYYLSVLPSQSGPLNFISI